MGGMGINVVGRMLLYMHSDFNNNNNDDNNNSNNKRRPGYRVEVIPIVIGCMGGGVGMMKEQVRKIIINSDTDKVCREMLRIAVMESESILRKVITNIVTGD